MLMGNCLFLQEKKVIRIMKLDGKILRYSSPLTVHQLLSRFPAGYSISDALPAVRYLDKKADMLGGRLYYLAPPPEPVTVSGSGSGVLRIKLVVTKQELREMLMKEGGSLHHMISNLQSDAIKRNTTAADRVQEICMGWRPALESIPEGNDPL